MYLVPCTMHNVKLIETSYHKLYYVQEEVEGRVHEILEGTEQLLFSFLIPSTLAQANNIAEIQKLVTQGENL